jgi:hypothetical protein
MAIIVESSVDLATKVRDVLKEAGGSVTNDLRTFFSSSAKLNMWAKYKPVVIANTPFINLWDNSAYKGDDKKCGLTIPVYSNYTTLQNDLKGNKGHYWSYTPPTGGENAPQRLSDFRRYNTNAINPIGSLPGNLAVTRIAGTDYLDLSVEVNVQSGHATNLSLTDITIETSSGDIALSSMYLGVYLVRKSGGKNDYFRTTSTTIGTNSKLDMRIPLSYEEAGTYTAYMFLSSSKQEGSPQNGTLLSLNKEGTEVKIIGAGTLYSILVSGYVAEAGTKNYHYEVVLKNNNSTAVTFEDIYVGLKYNSQPTTTTLIASSKSVPAYSSVTLTGTATHSSILNFNDLQLGMYEIYSYSISPNVNSGDGPLDLSAPI